MTSILDFQDRIPVIFGDGSGGVILEPTGDNLGIVDSILHMDGSEANTLLFLEKSIPSTKESVDRALYKTRWENCF